MLETKVYSGVKCAVIPNPAGKGKPVVVGPKKIRAAIKHGESVTADFLGGLTAKAIFQNITQVTEWLASVEGNERHIEPVVNPLPQPPEAIGKATVQEHLDTNNDELAQMLARLS